MKNIRFPQVVALALLAALTPLATDMYLPSLPAISADLHSSIELAQISLTIYLAVFSVTQLLFGPISDSVGRRLTIAIGLALFIGASLICALTTSIQALLFARALQALGGAAVAVTIPALVRDLYERDDYARMMSLVMLTSSLAPAIGPSLGSLTVTFASWRMVFLLLGIFAVVGILTFLRNITETLSNENRHSFDLPTTIRNYWRLTRHRSGMGYMLTGALSFGGMMTFIVSAPYAYIKLYGMNEIWFGLAFSINVVFAVTFATLNASLIRRFGVENLLRAGLVIQAGASLLAIAVTFLAQPPLWLIMVNAAMYISMIGVVGSNSMAGFMAFFPRYAGTASAFAGAARFGVGALIGTVVSLLHDGTVNPMLWGIALSGLASVATYFLLCQEPDTSAARPV